ncbi:MAG: heavy metal response regulator transcription factor [Deltaproteobacteria bacterium]|nr:heavy metal response regulator transcription factor [Deltaproteobacteria bacterium]MCL5791912.1 heavy metal response regulator transcription factor [Deltaproteobacteria bacterium]
MHILIIEDEKKTADYLRKGLTENGFVVETAENGANGLYYAGISDYDMIILDVVLPDMNGWSVLSEIRRNGKQTPVLFLTARDGVQDRVKGLELGADDYLIKPFAFSELLARIRSILRRGPGRLQEVLIIADLEIDLLKHKAHRADDQLDLTSKEFTLLAFLGQRKGEVISRTLIAEQVWGMNFDSDTNVVDVAIRRLRKKVDDPYEEKLIHTVRGVGYVLEER